MPPQEEKTRLHPALFAFLVLFLAPSPPVRACDTFFFAQKKKEAGQGETKADRNEDSEAAEEPPSITRHSARIGGTTLRYTATAGTLLMKKEDGTPRARIFYVAYTRDGVKDASERPLTFCFNGGPGSSSVWLHMGAFGPRRVVMADEGWALPPPYRLEDNEDSLLDLTDLVFIDPVTTGFSRAAKGQDPRGFHGVKEDVASVGDFIRLWTTRNDRWQSPKFLAGESYGTTRAAGLSGYLQERHGLYLNGIVLISSILNFETARFDRGNDLPFILFLPTYTATAWYHGKLSGDLGADLHKAVDAAREFASGEYTLALMKGDALSDQERVRITGRLAELTGLSREYVLQTNLRISISRFVKELLRGQRRTVGRLDSRFLGRDFDAAGENYEFDPSYAAIQGPFTGVFNHYVRADLEYENDLPYEILTGRVHPWSYKNAENQYLNVAETLRKAMTENPSLHVFVANGYFDFATPFFATQYTFGHMGLDPALRGHVRFGFYEAGHMMYIRKESHDKLKKDLAVFYASALGG